jgi:ubiquinone/menaquinone biosynthesis C-methylase UbiE
LAEFTGERVIPGQVDRDLWNEHFARYLFAARLCRNKRVLDLACGTGYGAAALAQTAARVTGLDNSGDAIVYAKQHYPNLRLLRASATSIPLPDATFDLITAFELIEHLSDWRSLLTEARRLLAPGGQFIVSTPNKLYYAESRRLSGPNPFHVHEFEFAEFREALGEIFPHVSIFVQNHADGVVFRPLYGSSASDLRMETATVEADTAHFFVAVCAMTVQTGGPTFVYLPSAGNVLREREQHIQRLEQELSQKDAWLAQAQNEHQQLLAVHRELKGELEARNRWADQLNRQLDETGARVVQLQDELASEQRASAETAAAYEAQVGELSREVEARTQWALDTESRLTGELKEKMDELARCVDILHGVERTVEERTQWAERLRQEATVLERKLSMVRASRWYRMGRTLGLGPEVRNP